MYILGFILVVSFKKGHTLSSHTGRECHVTFTTISLCSRSPLASPLVIPCTKTSSIAATFLSRLGTTLNDANNFTFEGPAKVVRCAPSLVIPCSGAAGHHRRFHTAAATSKKFPLSTFYVLIHHYCYYSPQVGYSHSRRSSPTSSWYWWVSTRRFACISGAPKGTRC